jgi:hypothetical protein
MADVQYQPPAQQSLVAQERPGRITWLLAAESRTHALLVAALSTLAGLVIATVWSAQVVDGMIGANIANTALGTNAKELQLSAGEPLLGIIFAFIAGVAATFTACNCVVFSCVAPLAAAKNVQQQSIGRILGWMALGVVVVTSAYGVAGALLGRAAPVLSTATLAIGVGKGYPIRLAQSTAVFVTLGIVLVLWGLTTLGLAPNPLRRLTASRPWFKPFALGLLIGFFTVGRPYPLFRKAFEYTADTGNPVVGASAIALQGLGNIAIMMVVLLVLLYATGGRFEGWLRGHSSRAATLTAISLIVGGVFFLAYWGLRVPSYYGIGWFPHMPYR